MAENEINIKHLLESARQQLAEQSAAGLEAEILLQHAMQVDRSFLYAHPELPLRADHLEKFTELLKRRRSGEPIAYITGEREFWSLILKINKDVLIPRSETELLVEAALQRIPAELDCRVADLGTGSGAVALAIASERPLCEVHATEFSASAIKLAQANAYQLGLERIHFHQGSWMEPLQDRFRLIVSNPPYVAEDDPHLLAGDCRFEPRMALTAGPNGLEAIHLIAMAAAAYLEPGGWLLLEHGCDQATRVRQCLRGLDYKEVDTICDLEGRERVTGGLNPGR